MLSLFHRGIRLAILLCSASISLGHAEEVLYQENFEELQPGSWDQQDGWICQPDGAASLALIVDDASTAFSGSKFGSISGERGAGVTRVTRNFKIPSGQSEQVILSVDVRYDAEFRNGLRIVWNGDAGSKQVASVNVNCRGNLFVVRKPEDNPGEDTGTSLLPGEWYHFQFCAENAKGTWSFKVTRNSDSSVICEKKDIGFLSGQAVAVYSMVEFYVDAETQNAWLIDNLLLTAENP